MRILIFLSFLVVSITGLTEGHSFYVGTWQSNEAMTLASMRKTDGVSEEAKQLFENNFFGKLVNIVKVGSYASYIIDEKPDKLEFIKTEVEILSPTKVRSKYFDKLTNSDIEQKVTYIGNCYYVLVSKWNFKEYFCRTS